MSVLPTCLTVAFVVSVVTVFAVTHRRQLALRVELALYPEVNSMSLQAAVFARELAQRYNANLQLDAAFFSTWRLSAPLIYPAVGAQLGYLSPDAFDRVGYFHAQLAEARCRVASAQTHGVETLSTYRLLSNVLRAYNHVEPWITSKGSRLGNLLSAKADVAEAARLLDNFETAAEEPRALAYCWADVADYPGDPILKDADGSQLERLQPTGVDPLSRRARSSEV